MRAGNSSLNLSHEYLECGGFGEPELSSLAVVFQNSSGTYHVDWNYTGYVDSAYVLFNSSHGQSSAASKYYVYFGLNGTQNRTLRGSIGHSGATRPSSFSTVNQKVGEYEAIKDPSYAIDSSMSTYAALLNLCRDLKLCPTKELHAAWKKPSAEAVKYYAYARVRVGTSAQIAAYVCGQQYAGKTAAALFYTPYDETLSGTACRSKSCTRQANPEKCASMGAVYKWKNGGEDVFVYDLSYAYDYIKYGKNSTLSKTESGPAYHVSLGGKKAFCDFNRSCSMDENITLNADFPTQIRWDLSALGGWSFCLSGGVESCGTQAAPHFIHGNASLRISMRKERPEIRLEKTGALLSGSELHAGNTSHLAYVRFYVSNAEGMALNISINLSEHFLGNSSVSLLAEKNSTASSKAFRRIPVVTKRSESRGFVWHNFSSDEKVENATLAFEKGRWSSYALFNTNCSENASMWSELETREKGGRIMVEGQAVPGCYAVRYASIPPEAPKGRSSGPSYFIAPIPPKKESNASENQGAENKAAMAAENGNNPGEMRDSAAAANRFDFNVRDIIMFPEKEGNLVLLDRSCRYSLDGKPWLAESIHVDSGPHSITVECSAGSATKSKQADFLVLANAAQPATKPAITGKLVSSGHGISFLAPVAALILVMLLLRAMRRKRQAMG